MFLHLMIDTDAVHDFPWLIIARNSENTRKLWHSLSLNLECCIEDLKFVYFDDLNIERFLLLDLCAVLYQVTMI